MSRTFRSLALLRRFVALPQVGINQMAEDVMHVHGITDTVAEPAKVRLSISSII